LIQNSSWVEHKNAECWRNQLDAHQFTLDTTVTAQALLAYFDRIVESNAM